MIFKKFLKFYNKQNIDSQKDNKFNIELIASLLIEIARIDGNIDIKEQEFIEKIFKNSLSKKSLINLIKQTHDSSSFYKNIIEINAHKSIDEKLEILEHLFAIAYIDGSLDINEEKIILQIADLMNLKKNQMLRIKNLFN